MKNQMFSGTPFIKFGHRAKANCEAQFAFFVEAFREMFNLLEEHAPTWYTEEHHRRAVAALGALQEPRQLGKTEAARSKGQVKRPSSRKEQLQVQSRQEEPRKKESSQDESPQSEPPQEGLTRAKGA